jgi:hypothetical protein
MTYYNLPSDASFHRVAGFEIDGQPGNVMAGQIDQSTGRILVDASTIISASMQTDVFVATAGQTTFTASKTVAYTIGFFIQTLLTPPNTSGAQADYSVASGVATLSNVTYPSGVPAGSIVVWVYSIT